MMLKGFTYGMIGVFVCGLTVTVVGTASHFFG